jgi:hypothetical protein
MSDIFSVSPPNWLVDLTRSNEKGLLGGIAGELAASPLIAMTKVSDDIKKRTEAGGDSPGFGERASMWLHDLPQSVAEAHLNFLDPTWKIKVRQGQLNIAQTGLQLQEMEQKINLNAANMKLRAEDIQNVPKWMAEHPTYESRRDAEWPTAKTPEWNRNLDQLRLRDSQSEQSKITVSGVKAFTDRLSALSKDDPAAAAQVAGAAQQYTAKGQAPTKAVTDALAVAEETVAQRKANEQAQQQMTLEAAIAKTESEGGTVQRTIGPKGESITLKPGAAGGKDTKPAMMELAGHQVIYNPKGGGFKIVSPQGKEKEMTPAGLLGLAKELELDPSGTNAATKIKAFLSETALKQIGGSTNTPAAKPVSESTGRIQVRDKNGKLFTVPKSQRKQAIDEGYTPLE